MQTEIPMFVFLLGGYRLPFTLIELDLERGHAPSGVRPRRHAIPAADRQRQQSPQPWIESTPTLEDTETTYYQLVEAFDTNVANLVLQVTDVSRPDSGNAPQGKGNRPLRNAIDRQFLAGASWQGQMIKCADMLSNTKDIVAHDLRFARVYVPEKKLLIDELTKIRKVSYPIWRAAYDSIVQAEQVVHAAA
jgi:hypothetical protein